MHKLTQDFKELLYARYLGTVIRLACLSQFTSQRGAYDTK